MEELITVHHPVEIVGAFSLRSKHNPVPIHNYFEMDQPVAIVHPVKMSFCWTITQQSSAASYLKSLTLCSSSAFPIGPSLDCLNCSYCEGLLQPPIYLASSISVDFE